MEFLHSVTRDLNLQTFHRCRHYGLHSESCDNASITLKLRKLSVRFPEKLKKDGEKLHLINCSDNVCGSPLTLLVQSLVNCNPCSGGNTACVAEVLAVNNHWHSIISSRSARTMPTKECRGLTQLEPILSRAQTHLSCSLIHAKPRSPRDRVLTCHDRGHPRG